MLVSHRYKFIYTKTIKTAGTSVESYFEKYCFPEGEWTFSHGRDEYLSESGIVGFRGRDAMSRKWYSHMDAATLKGYVGEEIWDSYFKFCVVRNPFDKLVSAFHYFENKDESRRTAFLRSILEIVRASYARNTLEQYRRHKLIRNFRNWVSTEEIPKDQKMFLIDGNVCVDDFIQYENLENGICDVCDKVGVPFEPERIPRLKQGRRSFDLKISDYYDQSTIARVKDVYNFEIERFGYDLDSSK